VLSMVGNYPEFAKVKSAGADNPGDHDAASINGSWLGSGPSESPQRVERRRSLNCNAIH